MKCLGEENNGFKRNDRKRGVFSNTNYRYMVCISNK